MGDLDLLMGGKFDAQKYANDGSNRDPIPVGWYSVIIEKVEIRTTKDGTGKFVFVQFSIFGEKYEGIKLFSHINIINKSAQAMEIGRAELGNLCIAAGVPGCSDTSELLEKTLDVHIKHVKKFGTDDEKVESVDRFRARGKGRTAVKAPTANAYAQQPAVAQQSAPAPEPELPWKKAPAKQTEAPSTPPTRDADDLPF